MKNNIREYIECACHTPEHTFSISCDEEISCVYLMLNLTTGPWYKRLRTAVKYVFGYHSRYGDFDEIMLDKEGIKALRKALPYYD